MLETRRNRIVEEHLPLVRSIAASIARSLPACYELDDLVQTGVLALYEALDSFDPERGCTFGSYARFRVRGAILDSLSRSCANDPELNEETPAAAVPIDDRIALRQSIAKLPGRERAVIERRYLADESLKEIGAALRISAARVAQIRNQALTAMRAHLEIAA